MKKDLSENFGFLIHDVARLLRWEFDRKSKNLKLTRAHWQVLAHLQRKEGLQQKDLAILIDIKPMTLARHLDNLEQFGWVERRDDPSDRRVKRVYLKAKAKPTINSLMKLGKQLRNHALKGLSSQEKNAFTQSLQKIRANLSDDKNC